MRVAVAVAVSALFACAACSANDDVPAPIVSAVVPDHAPVNAVVVVSGSYFCHRPHTGSEDPTCPTARTVQFGAAPGTASTYTDLSIMVEVPAAASGRADITVTAGGRTSNAVAFTVD